MAGGFVKDMSTPYRPMACSSIMESAVVDAAMVATSSRRGQDRCERCCARAALSLAAAASHDQARLVGAAAIAMRRAG